MRNLMTRIRRAIEAVLPWYDPEAEAVKERQSHAAVRQARLARRELASYHRVTVRK